MPATFARLTPVLLCLFISLATAHAQPATPSPVGTPISYGATVTGRLDNRAPLAIYSFEGLRGEYVALRLRATSGNLDPILTVVDEQGVPLLVRDDSDGGRYASVSQVRLPANRRYIVTVGRFGYALGTTAGDYELTLTRLGVSPESGSALRFGDTVANVISDAQPQVYYTFRAERGDIVTITMRRDSGTLDPYLQVVNPARVIVAENDDMPFSNDAQIDRWLVQESGQYLIIATRYGGQAGQTSGGFLLTLERGASNLLGTTPQVAVPILPGTPDRAEITNDRPVRYYTFFAQRDDLVTVAMNRLGGTLDPLLDLFDADLNLIASNDDIVPGANRNARIDRLRIPADGVYFIAATRYEREQGTTSGGFELRLEISGNAFAAVPSTVAIIEYGTTITGFLDDLNPQLLYAFYGEQGERVRVAMNRTDGNFLPVVTLLDSATREIAQSPPGSANALIDTFTLPQSGVYFLRATRQNSVGDGGFILLVNR